MPLDFPASPTNGQTYGNYLYDSSITAWRNVNSETGISTLNAAGLKNVVPTSIAVGSGSATVNANGFVTFSNASDITLNGVFTTDFESYRLVLTNGLGSTTSTAYLRMTSSGTADSSTNYYNASWYVTSAATSGQYGSAPNLTQNPIVSYQISSASNQNQWGFSMDIGEPKTTSRTAMIWQSVQVQAGVISSIYGSCLHAVTTSYDGFQLRCATGTFGGVIKVYGYN